MLQKPVVMWSEKVVYVLPEDNEMRKSDMWWAILAEETSSGSWQYNWWTDSEPTKWWWQTDNWHHLCEHKITVMFNPIISRPTN